MSKIFELIFWVILLFKVLFWVKVLFWEIFWGLFWANLLFWGLFWVTLLESDACLSTFTFLRTFKSPFFCQLLFWGLLKVLFFLLFPTQNLYVSFVTSEYQMKFHLVTPQTSNCSQCTRITTNHTKLFSIGFPFH